jgi:hypothetical protein
MDLIFIRLLLNMFSIPTHRMATTRKSSQCTGEFYNDETYEDEDENIL